MEKLNFITAGMPLKTNPKLGYQDAFNVLKDLNLDGLEMEFVHGVRFSDKNAQLVADAIKKGFIVTAHGPYYINLNSEEQEKIEASKTRIKDTARTAYSVGGYSITFHAAFYMKKDEKTVFNQVLTSMQEIVSDLKSEGVNIWIRPETTGKKTQWGDLDEIIQLSKEVDMVLPCVDFSHLHARHNGIYYTYDEFAKILDTIGTQLGQNALDNFHGHLAGIAYSEKGEKNHLVLEESDMNYKDLLKALKDFNVKGAIVCESHNIEDDCKLIKAYYESL